MKRIIHWFRRYLRISNNTSLCAACQHAEFSRLKWDQAPAKLSRWCEGTTGFPIVDAGMRELNATGYMHNRVRMIVAMFLTKDLHLHWREGEKYFMQKLVDHAREREVAWERFRTGRTS
jgi:deoxyribodipyrimidine photolyase